MKHFCGEIMYDNTYNGTVHSDICFGCLTGHESPMEEDRWSLYHQLLDEWLEKGNGTGIFWLGDPDCFYEKYAKEVDNDSVSG